MSRKKTARKQSGTVIRQHSAEVMPRDIDLEIAETKAKLEHLESQKQDSLMQELRGVSQVQGEKGPEAVPGANCIPYGSKDAQTAEQLAKEGRMERTPFGYMDASRKGW